MVSVIPRHQCTGSKVQFAMTVHVYFRVGSQVYVSQYATMVVDKLIHQLVKFLVCTLMMSNLKDKVITFQNVKLSRSDSLFNLDF